MMMDFSHKKKWNMVTVQVFVDPIRNPLIKIKNGDKSDIYFIKIKFHLDPTSEKLDLYEFKMALFENDKSGEFLLFFRNFNMTIEASGTLRDDAKIQYLCKLVCGEALRQFGILPAEVEIASPETFSSIILGLDTYFSPFNALSKKIA